MSIMLLPDTCTLKLMFQCTESCKVCNFCSLIFRNDVSNFQEHSNIAKIQVYSLPGSKTLTNFHYRNNKIFVKNYLSTISGGAKIITNKSKNTCFYKIIHFSMQFSAVVNRFIAKA